MRIRFCGDGSVHVQLCNEYKECKYISRQSNFPETIFGLNVLFYKPIECIFPLVVLLILGLSYLFHLFIIVVVQFVVSRFLLSQVDIKILTH